MVRRALNVLFLVALLGAGCGFIGVLRSVAALLNGGVEIRLPSELWRDPMVIGTAELTKTAVWSGVTLAICGLVLWLICRAEDRNWLRARGSMPRH